MLKNVSKMMKEMPPDQLNAMMKAKGMEGMPEMTPDMVYSPPSALQANQPYSLSAPSASPMHVWVQYSDLFDANTGVRVGGQLPRPCRPRVSNPSNTIVARAEGSTYDAKVWAVCLVRGPFSVSPRAVPNPTRRLGQHASATPPRVAAEQGCTPLARGGT
jgi:hypothetical protein